MNSIDELQLLYGKSLPFSNICMVNHPTLGDIAQIGTSNFYRYIYTLTLEPSEIEEKEVEMDTLSYLLIGASVNQEFASLVKQAFYFFTGESIVFVPEEKSIQVGNDIIGRITPENFGEMQHIISTMCCIEKEIKHTKFKDERARQIAERIAAGQKEVERIKAKNRNNDDTIDLAVLVSSIAARTPGMSILNIWQTPYYAFHDLVRRTQAIEEYDTIIRAAHAGAKVSKDNIKYWIRKIPKRQE